MARQLHNFVSTASFSPFSDNMGFMNQIQMCSNVSERRKTKKPQRTTKCKLGNGQVPFTTLRVFL